MGKPKLHEILAVEPDAKGQTNLVLGETEKIFKNPKEYIEGKTVVVESLLEDEPLHDGSEELIVTTVPQRTKYTVEFIAREAKISAAKAATNACAYASIVLPDDGSGKEPTLLENVPAEVLMKYIDKLKQVRGVIAAQPTLDSRTRWLPDPQRENVWMAPTTSKIGTRKVQNFEIVVQPTEHHRAEVRDVSKDIPARNTKTTVVSGAIPSTAKALQLKAIDRLIESCKRALERANSTEVVQNDDFRRLLELVPGLL